VAETFIQQCKDEAATILNEEFDKCENPVPVPDPVPDPVDPPMEGCVDFNQDTIDTFNKLQLDRHNELRADHGASPLVFDPEITR
jgi:hypothetical protein